MMMSDMLNENTESSDEIIVDNFRPYIQSLEAFVVDRQETNIFDFTEEDKKKGLFYSGEWKYNAVNDNIVFKKTDNGYSSKNGIIIEIYQVNL